MAKKINRSLTDTFSTALEDIDEWQTEINLKKFVEETFFSIEKAREKDATWEQIAHILQTMLENQIEIKADTVRQYYFDAVSKRDELARKKRRRTAKKRAKTPLSGQENPANLNSKQNSFDHASSMKTEDASENASEDSEGSFNLRSRKPESFS